MNLLIKVKVGNRSIKNRIHIENKYCFFVLQGHTYNKVPQNWVTTYISRGKIQMFSFCFTCKTFAYCIARLENFTFLCLSVLRVHDLEVIWPASGVDAGQICAQVKLRLRAWVVLFWHHTVSSHIIGIADIVWAYYASDTELRPLN